MNGMRGRGDAANKALIASVAVLPPLRVSLFDSSFILQLTPLPF